MALLPSDSFTLGNPDDIWDLLLFDVIGYGHGHTAADGANKDIHILPQDQLFGHAEAKIHLELGITGGKFDLLPQDPLFVNVFQGQFEAIEGLFTVHCSRSAIGIYYSHFDILCPRLSRNEDE